MSASCVVCGRAPARPFMQTCRDCKAWQGKSLERAEARGYARAKRQMAREAPGVNQIGHCGQWWAIQTLPWRCPRCAYVLEEKL